jgi:alpha-mannosidase
LQPTAICPSGESFVRQILRGKFFFRKEFKVDVTTAANLDSFGHTRGLVQILVKTGYVHYLFCRPFQNALPLQSETSCGSGSMALQLCRIGHRSSINLSWGQALSKVESWMQKRADAPHQMILWGMGIMEEAPLQWT